jgi:hypothetical protein
VFVVVGFNEQREKSFAEDASYYEKLVVRIQASDLPFASFIENVAGLLIIRA